MMMFLRHKPATHAHFFLFPNVFCIFISVRVGVRVKIRVKIKKNFFYFFSIFLVFRFRVVDFFSVRLGLGLKLKKKKNFYVSGTSSFKKLDQLDFSPIQAIPGALRRE